MLIILSMAIVSLAFILLLKLLSLLISEKASLNREEMTSYECGFEHHNLARVPFSLRYFFLTLIFLLFDLEVVFMLFLPSSLLSVSFHSSFLILSLFILILFISLIYEWTDGSLEWVN